jgi:hypothetical protein
MATTYSWQFPALDVIFQEGDLQNVVQAVHWIYQANNGNYYETTVGCSPLPAPMGTFIQYDDLTPEIVQGWVEAVLGEEKIAEMQSQLSERIELAMNPVGTSEPPPWQQ